MRCSASDGKDDSLVTVMKDFRRRLGVYNLAVAYIGLFIHLPCHLCGIAGSWGVITTRAVLAQFFTSPRSCSSWHHQ